MIDLKKPTKGFVPDEYRERLKLLREIISGENQQDFAERVGVPFKRWNNYERGYPVPRETAFILMEKFPGMSIEWIWFGMEGNLSNAFRERIRAVEKARKDVATAAKQVAKAQQNLDDKRKRLQAR